MGYRGRLTVAKAKSLTTPGMYRADPTLYLRVAPSGAKSWIQRLTIDGRRHDLGLGGFPLISIAEAREQAFENRRKVRAGSNPLAEKRRATVPTFAEAAEKRIVAERPNWRGPKSERDWRACFNNYVFPQFGAIPVDQVEREDVLRALTPIWTTMPETARRIRGRIRKVFEWAQAHRYIRDNPAGEAINGALPTIRASQQHFRALPVAELPKALKTVRDREHHPAHPEHGGDAAVPRRLGQDALLCVHEHHREVGAGGAGRHVARVLLVAGNVRDEERPPGGLEAPVGDVDGDALLAFGLQAVHEERQVGIAPLGAVAARGPLDRRELVLEDRSALVEQPADQRALPVVHAAADHEVERRRHQKYPSRFFASMDASPSWSISRPRRSERSAASVSASTASTVSASLSTAAVSG